MTEKKTIECPYCGEEILETAKKCKHCGEFLDGSKESRIGDYSNCKVYNEKHQSFMPDIRRVRCPRCGYIGKPTWNSGSYNGCLFRFLLLFTCIIGGIIYAAVTKKGNYVCPQCGENHLERL